MGLIVSASTKGETKGYKIYIKIVTAITYSSVVFLFLIWFFIHPECLKKGPSPCDPVIKEFACYFNSGYCKLARLVLGLPVSAITLRELIYVLSVFAFFVIFPILDYLVIQKISKLIKYLPKKSDEHPLILRNPLH